MTTSTTHLVSPADVHGILARHILADGFDIVLDFEKSHGVWLHDSRAGRDGSAPFGGVSCRKREGREPCGIP